MPSSIAKPTASAVSSIVTGSRSRISATTGLPVRHEVPRSPWARSPIQRPYCRHHGWSRPKKRLSSATIAGLTMASAPIICSTTVPGTSRSMRKTSSDRPEQRQGHRVEPDGDVGPEALTPPVVYALSSHTPSNP